MINRLPENSRASNGAAATSAADPALEELNKQIAQFREYAENLITQKPVACMAAAFVIGVSLAWLIKRR